MVHVRLIVLSVAQISPIGESAKWINGIGGIYSLGAVAGPLIGGSFVSFMLPLRCTLSLEITGIKSHLAVVLVGSLDLQMADDPLMLYLATSTFPLAD